MKQKIALGILQTGRNVFLTGSAGTGKTYLLNQYIDYLKERGIKPAIVAPTGIAASHIGGMTIHSFFGIGIMEKISDEYLQQLKYRKFLHNRLKNLEVLVIDEVSMVSPELFISMDKILQAFKYSAEPFGGVQIILSGDFFQLPPVSSSGQTIRFAWQTELWQNSNLRVCYLEEKFRQDDFALINILDEIRAGEVSEDSMEIFRSCFKKKLANKFRATRLYTHNVDVDSINETELNKLKAPLKTFQSFNKGGRKDIEKIFNTSLVTEELKLKKGVAVIFIKNNYERGYINGTLGKVVDFSKEEGLPIVEIFSGRRIFVDTEEWRMENDKGEVKASVKQIPLRLAWALTIHKSQGMTLDAAEIDLSKTFEVGQGYVALSRIKSIEGLRLMGLNDVALQVDELVLKIDQKMKELSQINVLKWQSFSKEEKEKMIEEFILNAGGTTDKKEIAKNKKNIKEGEKIKKEFFKKNNSKNRFSGNSGLKNNNFGGKKRNTIEITKKLLLAGKTVAEIATQRGLAQETIHNHIQKIVELLPDFDIDYLKPKKKIIQSVAKAIEKIKKKNNPDDFLEDGKMRLRAVFECLNKKISYDDIKLALLFIKDGKQ